MTKPIAPIARFASINYVDTGIQFSRRLNLCYAPVACIGAKARKRGEKLPIFNNTKCGKRSSLYWPAPRYVLNCPHR